VAAEAVTCVHCGAPLGRSITTALVGETTHVLHDACRAPACVEAAMRAREPRQLLLFGGAP